MKNWENDLLKQFKKQQTRFSEDELNGLIRRLPREYYKLSDPDDILQNLKYLDLILHNEKNKIVYQSDIETFALMTYDYTLLDFFACPHFYKAKTVKEALEILDIRDRNHFIKRGSATPTYSRSDRCRSFGAPSQKRLFF